MITGQQARELLDGTTRGPWVVADDAEGSHERYIYDWDSGHMCIAVADNGAGSSCSVSELRLAGAAPALAETVAWLYGREPDKTESGDMQIMDDSGLVVEYKPGTVSPGRSFGADLGDLTPDQAVDLARALLAAAEQARDE